MDSSLEGRQGDARLLGVAGLLALGGVVGGEKERRGGRHGQGTNGASSWESVIRLVPFQHKKFISFNTRSTSSTAVRHGQPNARETERTRLTSGAAEICSRLARTFGLSTVAWECHIDGR